MFDHAAPLRRFDALLAEAAEGGAELVVFPEAFVGGYPKGATARCSATIASSCRPGQNG